MSGAKQKAFERMLADIAREEEVMARAREKALTASAEEAQQKKEAEVLKRQQILEDRERRAREKEERKLAREGAALAKRRAAEARMAKYKADKEAALLREIESKTKHSYEVKGDLRPDGRINRRKIKEKAYMYFGDFAEVGQEKTDELKKKWGRFADPDLYFWVPHGYGEWRNHSAEDAFMEGEMVSGVMQGMGVYRFGGEGEDDEKREYKGLFMNDRPQGFGVDSRPSGDPEHPVAHRLAVYQRGKQICYLDELRPGARIKLFGQEHHEFLSDPRNSGGGARPSTLPVMPHAKNHQFRLATIVEACGGPGVFRVKPDFSPSLVVNLSSTLWDLERAVQPLFQGLELYTGEHEEARFRYDPTDKFLHTGVSDHRENFFGASSRVKLAGEAELARQKVAAGMYAEHKAAELAKIAEQEKLEAEKEDRKQARKMQKAEIARAKAEAAAEQAERAEIGLAYLEKAEAREERLALSKPAAEEGDHNQGVLDSLYEEVEDKHGNITRQFKPRKPFEPNSGRLIFDDQRWVFIPNGVSLPGPPKPDEVDAKTKKGKKAKALAAKKKAAIAKK